MREINFKNKLTKALEMFYQKFMVFAKYQNGFNEATNKNFRTVMVQYLALEARVKLLEKQAERLIIDQPINK